MNTSSEQLQQIASMFQEAVRIIIFLPEGAKSDECASAVGMANLLRAQKKECRIISPTPPKCTTQEVPGSEEISAEIGKDNLVVSFEYEATRVDKVSYHIGEDSGRFYLTIRPKLGSKPLDADTVKVEYAGVTADVLVLIGVVTLDRLEPFSSELSDVFSQTPSLALTKNGTPEVGTVKIECEGLASLSEEVSQLAMQMGWEITGEAATALLRGIETSTDWLTAPSTTAQTFETVAALLRAGARRLKRPVAPMAQAAASKTSQPVSLADAMRARTATLPMNPTVTEKKVEKNEDNTVMSVGSTEVDSKTNQSSRQSAEGIVRTQTQFNPAKEQPQPRPNTSNRRPDNSNASNQQSSLHPVQTPNSPKAQNEPNSPGSQLGKPLAIKKEQTPQSKNSSDNHARPQPSTTSESTSRSEKNDHLHRRGRHRRHSAYNGHYLGRKKPTA